MGEKIHTLATAQTPLRAGPALRGLSSIGTKLTLVISLVIAVGFGSIVYFYAQQQEKNIMLQHERAIKQVLDSVNQGLQTVMITASADVAQLYADKLGGYQGHQRNTDPATRRSRSLSRQ